MERARRLIERWGIWIGFFCWIAVLGDAILLTLGIMRSNAPLTLMTMAIGKTIRYLVILLSALGIGNMLFA
jgi:membrane protein YqaA with SNARE-associated domain